MVGEPVNGAKVSTNQALRERAKEAAGREIAKTNGATEHPIMVLLTKYDKQIGMALPKTGLDLERFKRIAVTTYNTNKDLQKCEPLSFLAACMLAAQMGLEPGGPMGQAWLVPYGDKVEFQIGYQGYLTMMWRSNQYRSLSVHEVCKNDEFELEYGLEEKCRHKPALKDRGDTIGYYLVAHYLNGGHFTYWMSVEDVERIRRSSKSPNSPMWTKHFDAAGRKTILRQAARWMPKSIEVERNLAQDGAVKSEILDDMTAAAGEYVMEADYTDKGEDSPNREPGDDQEGA